MKNYRILAINPGSTSTKITVYDGKECILKETIKHNVEELRKYENIYAQREFRKEIITELLSKSKININDIDAVVGRGGFLPEPLASGIYIVDDNVCNTLTERPLEMHASNLGAIIAKSIADDIGKLAYIVDPVSVNETEAIGKISGMKGIKRRTFFHCLNVKAAGRKAAAMLGSEYEKLNLIIAHLGGGISVSAHNKGVCIDSNCGLLGEGTFSPERAGTIGQKEMMDLCFNSGKSRSELEKYLCGKGGLVSYLGTNDCLEVEKLIDSGNEEAKLVYEAMAYQISKDIAAQASVLKGKVDAVIITGGVAYSERITAWIKERVSFIAPVVVLAGEFEQEALTFGVLRVLEGREQAKKYLG